MREVIISFMENVKGCVDLLDDQYYVRDCTEYHNLERDITSIKNVIREKLRQLNKIKNLVDVRDENSK